MLEPRYSSEAAEALDRIEADPSRWRLWDAIADVIDLICDHPESAGARRERVRIFQRKDLAVWKVPIRAPWEDQDWSLIWYRDDDEAVVLYVGDGTN